MGRSKGDVVRELRALRVWAGNLGRSFPSRPYEGRGFIHWKIPVRRALVNPPAARLPIQIRCAQVLIDAAASLAKIKPGDLKHARVVAIIGLPEMFSSEVCVFFDETYFANFRQRDSEDQTWRPIEEQSLVERWRLEAPPSFSVQGFETLGHDRETGLDVRGQVWLIGELASQIG